MIAQSVSNDGSYDDFDVPEDIVPADNYMIQINHKKTDGIWDNSDSFEIKETP